MAFVGDIHGYEAGMVKRMIAALELAQFAGRKTRSGTVVRRG